MTDINVHGQNHCGLSSTPDEIQLRKWTIWRREAKQIFVSFPPTTSLPCSLHTQPSSILPSPLQGFQSRVYLHKHDHATTACKTICKDRREYLLQFL